MLKVLTTTLDACVVLGGLVVAFRAVSLGVKRSRNAQKLVQCLARIVQWADHSVKDSDVESINETLKNVDFNNPDAFFMTASALPVPASLLKDLSTILITMIGLPSRPDPVQQTEAVQLLVESFEEVFDHVANATCVFATIVASLDTVRRRCNSGQWKTIHNLIGSLALASSLRFLQSDAASIKIGLKILSEIDGITETCDETETRSLNMVRYFSARLIATAAWPRDKYESLRARRVEVDAARKLSLSTWLSDALLSQAELLTSWGYETLYEESLPLYDELASMARREGDLELLQLALERAATNAEKAGQLEASLERLDTLITFYNCYKRKEIELVRAQERKKGDILCQLGRFSEAVFWLQRGVERVVLSESDVIQVESRLIEAEFELQCLPIELSRISDVETAARSVGDNHSLSRILRVKAEILYSSVDWNRQDQLEQILAICGERLQFSELDMDYKAIAECCAIMSLVTLIQGRSPDESLLYQARAITLFNRVHNPIPIATLHYRRGLVFSRKAAEAQTDEPRVAACTEAIAAFESALRIVRNAELDMQSLCYDALAKAFIILGDATHAVQFLQRRRKMCLKANDISGAKAAADLIEQHASAAEVK